MPLISKARRALSVAVEAAANSAMAGIVSKQLAASQTGASSTFDCVIYFADQPQSVYQVRQWLEPMARLAERHPVALLVRNTATARKLLHDVPIPVFLTRGIDQVERSLAQHQVRIIFYVNNNRDNFTVLRVTEQDHIHLSHGESDKVSMASNQLKAYDFAFIAGEASRQRILTNVRRLDPAKLVEVGRPQLDVAIKPTKNDDSRVTVLYAPTWEGDRPAMSYGSVRSHGTDLVKALLADNRYRLIFRPHPRTGIQDPAHFTAMNEITDFINQANKRDPAARHYRDAEADFSAAMAQADVCICDISAMAMDWLPRNKPMLVTRPTSPDAIINPKGITAVVPLMDSTDAKKTPDIIAALLRQGVSQAQRDLVHHHFGDTSPGASTQRFLHAVHKILNQ